MLSLTNANVHIIIVGGVSHNAICSNVARVGSALIMVSLTVLTVVARSTVAGVIAYSILHGKQGISASWAVIVTTITITLCGQWIMHRECLIHSPHRFHHSCKDWRHSHWWASGSWLLSIQVYIHNGILQPNPTKWIEMCVKHGKSLSLNMVLVCSWLIWR